MQGHVRRRGKESWEYIVDVGMGAAERCQKCRRRFWVERKPRGACPRCGGNLIETEERRRQTRACFGTRKEAQSALSKLLVSVEEKSFVAQTRLTLREYLTKEWLPAIEATVRPSTYGSYRQHVECHLCPQLGSVQLQKLSGSQINTLYAKLALSGKKGGGLFCVLWAITRLATSPADLTLAAFLVVGLVLLATFVAVERRQAEPMLDLSLFRVPTMTPTLFAALLQGLANFATLFLVTMYLQGVRQLTPLHAALVLVPGYLVGAFVGPYAGRLADRLGPVYPATVGMAIQCVALATYAHLSLATPLWVVVVAAIINGIGAGAFFPANNAAVMKAAPGRSFGVASGVLRTFANVGMVFSFSVAVLIAAHSVSRGLAFAIFVGTTHLTPTLAVAFTTGVHAAFYASMGFMVCAALLSATRVRHQLGQRSP
jgi:hypothetical protein